MITFTSCKGSLSKRANRMPAEMFVFVSAYILSKEKLLRSISI